MFLIASLEGRSGCQWDPYTLISADVRYPWHELGVQGAMSIPHIILLRPTPHLTPLYYTLHAILSEQLRFDAGVIARASNKCSKEAFTASAIMDS